MSNDNEFLNVLINLSNRGLNNSPIKYFINNLGLIKPNIKKQPASFKRSNFGSYKGFPNIFKSLKLNSVDLEDGDVIVIAQKIVSKSENRYKNIDEVVASKEAEELAKKLNREPGFIQIILDESSKILSTEKNVIIVEHKLGFININAGLDRSNIEQDNNIVLLLPDDPSASAINLQESISRKSNQSISLIISDSMTRPYRSGVTNFALASSNLQSLIDLKGELDIYGNTLKSTEIAIADELSAAAGILMGQGDDGQPVIIIKGFNRDQYSKNDAFNLIVNEEDDLYR